VVTRNNHLLSLSDQTKPIRTHFKCIRKVTNRRTISLRVLFDERLIAIVVNGMLLDNDGAVCHKMARDSVVWFTIMRPQLGHCSSFISKKTLNNIFISKLYSRCSSCISPNVYLLLLFAIMTVTFPIKVIKRINYRPHDLYNSVPSEPFYGE
jgi:hypothetical protein